MMLALTGPLLHKNLLSRTTLVLITLLEKLLTKSSLVPNHTQIPMSVKLGFYRSKHNLCCSEFCTDLPSHTHDENSTKNELFQKLLRPQLSQALLDRERDFKRNYSSIFERCREQTACSYAYRNRFKLGHHLAVGQKVLYENHRQDLSKSQKYNNDDCVLSLLRNV